MTDDMIETLENAIALFSTSEVMQPKSIKMNPITFIDLIKEMLKYMPLHGIEYYRGIKMETDMKIQLGKFYIS